MPGSNADKNGSFTISGPWWLVVLFLTGATGAGVGSEYIPGWIGKEKTVSLSPESQREIDALSLKVSALSIQIRRALNDLDQVTGDFGDLASITARINRIATHLAAVDRRVDSLEGEGGPGR